MTIAPDGKDWTWVLRRPCPECGLDTNSFAREEIPAMIRANATAWQQPLTAPDAARRPRPDKWSALEYGCHVRDVHRLYDFRLGLMLTETDRKRIADAITMPGRSLPLNTIPRSVAPAARIARLATIRQSRWRG